MGYWIAAATLCGWLVAQAGTPIPPQKPARVVVLQNLTLIDGTGAAPRPAMDVVLEGTRIRSVGPAGTLQAPPDAEAHDLRGRFLVPGLVDSHVHLMTRFSVSRDSAFAELRRMLYSGIVMGREMAGDTRLTAEAARAIAIGDAPGPDLYYAAVMAGPNFFRDDPRPGPAARGFRPGHVPWGQAMTADTDIRLAVARAAGTLATGLKLYVELDGDLARRITDEAHRQGLKVWAHSTVYPARPLAVVRAGVDGITHACGLAWQSAALDPSMFRTPSMKNRPRFDPTLVQVDSAEMKMLFAEMVRRGTTLEPTLAIHLRPNDDPFGCTTALTTALTRAAHRAGVAIVAGTDFVTDVADPYPALHVELEALVDGGGLTPLEAITAATRNAARTLGLEATHGTIEPGKVANLVVLAGDPAENIQALRTVVTVIKRGVLYPREQYKASDER